MKRRMNLPRVSLEFVKFCKIDDVWVVIVVEVLVFISCIYAGVNETSHVKQPKEIDGMIISRSHGHAINLSCTPTWHLE